MVDKLAGVTSFSPGTWFSPF